MNPIDLMFDALAAGDVAAARAACTPDARIWHSYDGLALTLDEIEPQWAGLVAGTAERIVTDVRRQETPGGFVQQHLFVIRPLGGARKAWPVCVVARVEDGRIARLDEYIDRSGAFAPGEGEVVTPGF